MKKQNRVLKLRFVRQVLILFIYLLFKVKLAYMGIYRYDEVDNFAEYILCFNFYVIIAFFFSLLYATYFVYFIKLLLLIFLRVSFNGHHLLYMIFQLLDLRGIIIINKKLLKIIIKKLMLLNQANKIIFVGAT